VQQGTVAGYPLKDVRVRLVGGKHHDTGSSELAFRLAASTAFREAMPEAPTSARSAAAVPSPRWSSSATRKSRRTWRRRWSRRRAATPPSAP